MEKTFEILGTDLKEEVQAKLCEALGISDVSEGNWDVFPLAVLQLDDMRNNE